MKKKLIALLITLAAAVAGACALAGCTPNSKPGGDDRAHEHVFEVYQSNGDATCLSDGTKTAHCTYIGCTMTDTVTDTGSKREHWYVEYLSNGDATCTEDGTKTAHCNYGCGAEDTVADENSAFGHSMTDYVPNGDATCTEDGTKTSVCGNGCGLEDTVTDVGSHGHFYPEWISNHDATCTEDGTMSATCSRCGHTETETVEGSALGHSMTGYISNWDATCTHDGTKTNRCSRPDCTLPEDTIPDEEHPRLGHNFYNYVSDGNATCTEDGTKTSPCGNGWIDSNGETVHCDETDTQIDDGTALGHSFIDYISDGEATCTQDGTKTGKCERCDETDTQIDEAHHIYEYGACKFCKTIFTFDLSEDKTYYIVTGCTDTFARDIEIPAADRGLPVKAIGDFAFSNCENLTSVKIPESIEHVGKTAFNYREQIKDVYITNLTAWCNIEFEMYNMRPSNPLYGAENLYLKTTVKNEDESVTEEITKIEFLVIPKEITEIKDYAFYGYKGLSAVTIGDDVKSIGNLAFAKSTVYSAKLGNNIEKIATDAFENSSLQSVEVNKIDTWLDLAIGYVLKNANSNPKYLMMDNKWTTELIIPDSVTEIENYAFYNLSNIKTVKLPEGLTDIGDYAFSECTNLNNINLPDGVTKIGDYAFSQCTNLNDINLPDGLSHIGEYAFWRCDSLFRIIIPKSVVTIDAFALYNCKALTIYCERETQPDGWHKDWNYSLDSSYSGNIPTVWNCKNNETADDGYIYTVVDGIRYALKDNTATVATQSISISGEITIPDTVLYNEKAYTVTEIAASAFWVCNSLRGITIPDTIERIGANAFGNVGGHIPLNYNDYDYAIYLGNINNPYMVLVSAYSTAISSRTINENVKIICPNAFTDYDELTLTYNGTVSEWQAVEKTGWLQYVNKWTVRCTDGELRDMQGAYVTSAEQWTAAFDLTAYERFSVLVINRTYNSWNKFTFSSGVVGNIWGAYDQTADDPYTVEGELLVSFEGTFCYRYERQGGEWTKEEIADYMYEDTKNNCLSSVPLPRYAMSAYEYDSESGKYQLITEDEWSMESATVTINTNGKLNAVEYTTPFDPDTFQNNEYSIIFTYNVDAVIPDV